MNWDEIHPDDRIDAKLLIARGEDPAAVYKAYHGTLRSAHWRLGLAGAELKAAIRREARELMRSLGLWK